MAEAFANHYGGDVLSASSSGLAPAQGVPPNTVRAMGEMGIDISSHMPRLYNPFEAADWDIVVNMSGYTLPGPPPKEVVEWEVQDPFGSPMDTYRVARGNLERLVMSLILNLRRPSRKR
jgi:arsenate reductase (thioredoxin)